MAPVGRPPKYNNVEELQELIDEYFENCDLQDRPYTMAGLALALNLSRQGLLEYSNKTEYSDAINAAKLRCHRYSEEYLYSGKAAAGAIFSLKNNYGWKDKTEVETNVNVKFSLADLHKGTQQLQEINNTVQVVETEVVPAITEEDQIVDNWKANTIILEDN